MTTTTSKNDSIIGQPLACYDHEVAQRVQGWLDSGQLLAWIPIVNQANFPDTPLAILQDADAYQATLRVPIYRPADLLDFPEGVTGWLLPFDDENTDVACGVWAGEVYVLGVTDSRTGRKQTLLGEALDPGDDIAAGSRHDGSQSAV